MKKENFSVRYKYGFRFLSLCVGIFFLLSFSFTTIAVVGVDVEGEVVITSEGAFPDIGNHWAKDEIAYLTNKGVIQGYPDGTFRPNDPINRAEIAVLICRMFDSLLEEDEDDISYMSPGEEFLQTIIDIVGVFPDVDVNSWYGGCVMSLRLFGGITGYPDGTYRPGANMNRAEFITMLMRMFLYDFAPEAEEAEDELDIPFEGKHLITPEQLTAVFGKTDLYSDLADSWYTPYVTVATRWGIIQGSECAGGRCFNAGSNITRAEVAAIIYRSDVLDMEDVFLGLAEDVFLDIDDDLSDGDLGSGDAGGQISADRLSLVGEWIGTDGVVNQVGTVNFGFPIAGGAVEGTYSGTGDSQNFQFGGSFTGDFTGCWDGTMHGNFSGWYSYVDDEGTPHLENDSGNWSGSIGNGGTISATFTGYSSFADVTANYQIPDVVSVCGYYGGQ